MVKSVTAAEASAGETRRVNFHDFIPPLGSLPGTKGQDLGRLGQPQVQPQPSLASLASRRPASKAGCTVLTPHLPGCTTCFPGRGG